MAQLGIQFDATQVEPQSEMGVLPSGWYIAAITKSEMKQTAKKDGSYLALEYTLMDEKAKGRKAFENLNINNKNATAVEIAYATLSAICHATGVFQVQDSQQLHGIPLQIKLGLEPAGKGPDGKDYPDRNTIDGHKAVDGSTPVAGSPAPGQAAPAWATQQPAPAPVQQAAPAFAPAPMAAPAPIMQQAEPVKVMTEKANGATYEQFISSGWTEAAMIADGYLVVTQPAPAPMAAPAPVAPAPAPSATPPWQAAAPAQNAAVPSNLPQPTAATQQAAPPWAK